MKAPKHRRKILLGVVASISVLVASAAYVQIQADKSWRAMVALGEEVRQQWQRQPQARTPLWGEATDECAFEHYSRAATLIDSVDGDRRAFFKMIGKSDAEVAALAAELRPAWQPSIAAMHSGAHSLRALRCAKGVGDEESLNLRTFRSVTNAAMLEARILRHEGNATGSMQLTLDSMTMASDIFHSGVVINQMIGIALLAIAMDPWPDEELAQLDEQTAASFARGLARLDERMPTRMLTSRETLWMAEHLQKVPNQGDWCGMGTWRYGFSQRWMLADAVLMTARNFERLEQVPGENWIARKELYDQIVEEVLASSNTAAHCMFPHLISAEQSIRHTVGHVRMLRMALDMHRGIASEPLADPFGTGALVIEENDRKLLIKSIGNAGHGKLERLVSL